MPTMQEATRDFLAQKRIAVVGVSRTQNNAANIIYRKLRSENYKVFAVNPNAATVEGDTCYSNLKTIPEKPDGVVVVTAVLRQPPRERTHLQNRSFRNSF